jgi:ankyrin repeat protein
VAGNVPGVLIAAGADVNAMDNNEDSPFLFAGAEGRLEILKMTVASGADLKSVNRCGGPRPRPQLSDTDANRNNAML